MGFSVDKDLSGIVGKIQTVPNIEVNDKVSIIVYNKKTRMEITNYGNIDDLFGNDDIFEDIIVGIKPVV